MMENDSISPFQVIKYHLLHVYVCFEHTFIKEDEAEYGQNIHSRLFKKQPSQAFNVRTKPAGNILTKWNTRPICPLLPRFGNRYSALPLRKLKRWHRECGTPRNLPVQVQFHLDGEGKWG